jgi:CubicO group peptidase (beta-lactamase class C family)
MYFYKALYYNFADIDDYTIFPNNTIKASPNPEPWPVSKKYNKKPIADTLKKVFEINESIAFLIIKNDSLLHEQYWNGYSENSLSGSFSAAKSFVSALVGIAIKEGKIKSIEQPVSDYLDWFKEGEKKKIKIKDLLTMSSGLEWNEAYANPLSVTTEAYYGSNLEKLFANQKVESAPGQKFDYKSGDTEILGFILRKATGKSLAEYMQEKLWQPMGVERDALWSTDKKNGMEKAYCCINSNARDFARLGYLYLHKGNWKGKQIIDSSFVKASLSPNMLPSEYGTCDFYGYQWWLIPDFEGTEAFYARGILGQFIIVVPEWDMIAVRLGKNRGERNGPHFNMVFDMLKEMKSRHLAN